MKVRNKTVFLIEREEGLALLDVWNKMGMVGMKCYGDTNLFLRVGNILRTFEDKHIKIVRVDVEDYFAFSINIITNYNLIEEEG